MILLIADSICGGFGQIGKKSFVHLAAQELNIEIWDESAPGMSTSDYLEHRMTGRLFAEEQKEPMTNLESVRLVIVSLGNVDGKKSFSPNNFWSKLVPNRYRLEKIDPRPYYSKRRWKYVLERSENVVRHLFRHFSKITGNLKDTVPFLTTEHNFREILKTYSSKRVLLISTSTANNFHFPGAETNFSRTNDLLESISKNNPNIDFLDVRTSNRSELLEDLFHLNHLGHLKARAKLLVFLKSASFL